MNTSNKTGWIIGIVLIIILILAGIWWWRGETEEPILNETPVVNATTTPKAPLSQKRNTSTVNTIIASLSQASSFNSYFVSTGVSSSLTGKGPYTVFVPVNTAFGKLKPGTISNLSAADKKRLVQYHIVPNRSLDVDAISYGTIQALSKDMLNFDAKTSGNFRVNSSQIIESYQGSNGIVYLVNEILLPPERLD